MAVAELSSAPPGEDWLLWGLAGLLPRCLLPQRASLGLHELRQVGDKLWPHRGDAFLVP